MNPCHYFAIKHDISSNEFKTPDSTEQMQYGHLVINWLCRRYDYRCFSYSFKTTWITITIWENKLCISLDLRDVEQQRLFDHLPDEIKGTKQKGTGKLVNTNSLYFNVDEIVKFDYPAIVKTELWHTYKSKDNDGDDFYSYTYKLHLSDGTILYSLSQDKKEPISMQYTFPAKIQERAFLKYLKGI